MPAAAQPVSPLEAFQWEPQPEAEAMVRGVVRDFLARCPAAVDLERRLRDQTGTRFFDWIDSIHAPASETLFAQLAAAGFREEAHCATREPSGSVTGRTSRGVGEPAAPRVFAHPAGMFPRIVPHDGTITRLLLKVESVADFLAAEAAAHPAEEPRPTDGLPFGRLRQARVATGDAAEFWAVERHAYRAFDPPKPDAARALDAQRCLESFRQRRREFPTEAAGFQHLHQLIDAALESLELDAAWVADLFFAAEREYWQRRNRAAQVQKARQDRLGLGWANHDHHTYRSSRAHFAALIAVFEKLGFTCRERFYAGADAGWGAQILEQPTAGIIIFADVDLSPEELVNDFSHEGLKPRKELGTVGLWCALHGEAILEAGMHHLECQFDFDSLKQQLEGEAGVRVMKPFTNFPYLRQAFTEGEVWPVKDARIEKLLANRQITPAQAQQFRERGAIGSHLENLERNQGFKGFNQKGVSEIIQRTDPRTQSGLP